MNQIKKAENASWCMNADQMQNLQELSQGVALKVTLP